MPGDEFFRTGMGHDYYERTLPHLIQAINALAAEMKRANDLKEKELTFQGVKFN